MAWWFFDAWKSDPLRGWRRLYSRGPMRLADDGAQEEYLDTRESFQTTASLVRGFFWNGRSWEQGY